jgi:hypothetical protein
MAEQAKDIYLKHYSSGEMATVIFKRIICVCSAGLIFPLAWSENIDTKVYDDQFALESDKHKLV